MWMKGRCAMSHAACRIRSLAHWELDMDMDMERSSEGK